MVARQKYSFYPPSKNGLWQEAAQGTNKAPLWLWQQKNQACRSNNAPHLLWNPKKKNPHRIHNLRCCRHAISLQCHLWAGPIEHFQSLLHSIYLCLKVPATFGVVTVFDSQKEAKNIEHGFALCHKNVRFLREDTNQPKQPSPRQEISVEFKKAIKAEGDFTRLALDPRVPDSTVCIGAEISPQ
jgi:hypothetical protein